MKNEASGQKVAIPTATGKTIRRIAAIAKVAGVRFKSRSLPRRVRQAL